MYIASAATSVKFHDFPNGNVVYNYQPGSKVDGSIRSISWSKDGNWLALVPHSGLTEIISVRDQLKLVYTIYDIEEPSCASFQNNTKKNIALGTKGGQVLVYDIKARKVYKRFPRTTSSISHVTFVAKDTHVVAASTNGDIYLYNSTANNLTSTFRIPKAESVSALQPNATKRNLLIAGSNEGVVVLWDTHVNKPLFYTEAHKAPVTAVCFSPINSDLILTTGLDRQFSFYDTVSKKCIANVSVENNITAADWARDAINFVVASQSGKIYVYDSRNIQEPVCSFDAHNSTIKHLSLQKLGDTETSFITACPESIKEKQASLVETIENKDSFALYVETSPNVVEADTKSPPASCAETGDSFMAAMGFGDSNNETSKQENSGGIVEGVKKWMESKTCFNETPFSSNPEVQVALKAQRLLHEKMLASNSKPKQISLTPKYIDAELLSNSKPKQISSTPKYIDAEMLPNSKPKQISSTPKYIESEMLAPVSPIISCNQSVSQTCAKAEDVTAAVKESVKSAFQEFLVEMKKDVEFQVKSNASQLRRICLDMQMVIVKGFLKIEDDFANLKDELAGELPLSDHSLVEENMRLKKRIAELEDQLNTKNQYI